MFKYDQSLYCLYILCIVVGLIRAYIATSKTKNNPNPHNPIIRIEL